MRFNAFRLAVIAIALENLRRSGRCTTTGTSARSPGSQAGDSSGVTVFGTMDVGVGGVR